MDLLEKASVILTPTAYNNGEALCVKPSDGSGDFDFSRNSAATRVNAQGLVENVQILSSNLVQNGDFSEEGVEEISNGSFSQEGVQLVTNGSFDTDSDWSLNGWNISGGTANNDGVNTGNINQNIGLQQNKFYKISITITNYVSGALKVRLGTGTQIEVGSANGEYTLYLENTTTNPNIRFYPDATLNFNGSIDNCSVREVGQDWTLETGWSIGEDKAINDGTSGFLIQSNILTIGKTYKITYTLLNVASGKLRFREAGVNGTPRTSNGTYTDYITAASTRIAFQAYDGFNGSITNISVKEVGQDWTLGTGWSIGENKAICEANGGFDVLNQGFVLNSGNSYKVTYTADLSLITSGTLKLGTFGNSVSERTILDGTNTAYLTASGTSFAINEGGAIGTATITNISVIEITDDTNLPRINYEGFSYQDALGSELISNGNDTSDIVGLSDNQNITIQTSFLTIGKTYQIDFEIYDYVDGSIFLLRPHDLGVGSAVSANGQYTYKVVADASTSLIFRTDGLSTTLKLRGISVKEYLGQEVVPDSGCGSWLFEPQSTNEIEYSNDYTDAYWIKATSGSGIAPVVTSNYAISPDGTQNADRIQFDATTSGSNADRSRIRTTLSLTDTSDYTFSFYAKSTDGTDQNIGILFDNSQIATFTITDEWQRFEDTATQFGTSSICGLDLRSGIASTSDILVYGIQVEEQSYSTSLIPTDGTSVTRNQDLCTNGATGTGLINSTEGVLYAEIAALADDLTNRMIALSDSDSTNHVRIYYTNSTNKISVAVKSNGSNQYIFLNHNVSDITDYIKIAVKYKANDFATFINGVEVNSQTTTSFAPIGLDRLNFNSGSVASPFFGKTKALAVWKEALSDSELQELTTI